MDTFKLHMLIKELDISARPTNPDKNAPATVDDLNRAISHICHTLDLFVTELERK